MEYYSFLLQKEGGKDWLDLSQPIVEIKEGKYRLIAQCPQANVEVMVSMIREFEENGEVIRRVKKRLRPTNEEGMLVICSFTDFKPGMWQISLANELDKTEANLKLIIWAKEVETSDLMPNKIWNQDISSQDLNTENLSQENSSSFVLTEEKREQNLTEDNNISIANGENPIDLGLRLILEKDSFIRCNDEPILVSGEIDSWYHVCNKIFQGTIYYQLRDPETGETIIEEKQDISPQNLPVIFHRNLDLPSTCNSYLILGEVIIEGSYESSDLKDSLFFVERQSFTITSNVNDLLVKVQPQKQEIITKQEVIKTQEKQSLSSKENQKLNPSTPTTPSLFNTKKCKKIMTLQPVSSKVLPDKIKERRFNKEGKKLPDLPGFLKSKQKQVDTWKNDLVKEVSEDISEDISKAIPKEIPREFQEELLENIPEETQSMGEIQETIPLEIEDETEANIEEKIRTNLIEVIETIETIEPITINNKEEITNTKNQEIDNETVATDKTIRISNNFDETKIISNSFPDESKVNQTETLSETLSENIDIMEERLFEYCYVEVNNQSIDESYPISNNQG